MDMEISVLEDKNKDACVVLPSNLDSQGLVF